MDSKLIFISSETLKNKIIWTRRSSNSEWIYVGCNDDLKIDILAQEIQDSISTQYVYLVIGRNEVYKILKSELLNEFISRMKLNFFIWDTNFNNVIEYNNIGVIRKGEKASL